VRRAGEPLHAMAAADNLEPKLTDDFAQNLFELRR
jgi:hypothetical protein